jgi:hypothetical protein
MPKKPKTAPAESHQLTVIPPTPVIADPDLAKKVENVRRYRDCMGVSLSQFSAFGVMAGLEMGAIKKSLPHGKWEAFFDEHLKGPKFSLRTAQICMGVAGGIKSKVIKNADSAFLALLEKAPSQLGVDDALILQKAVGKLTDGKTFTELGEEMGVLKKHGSSKSTGGNNGGSQAAPPTAEKAAQEAYTLIVGPVVKALTMYDHEQGGFPLGKLLSDPAIAELAGAIVDFSERLKAARAAAKKP